MRKYAFMYILTGDIELVRRSLGEHVSYWKGLELEYFKNGPFADKTGGLIIFSAAGTEGAEEVVAGDPLITEKAVEQYWLKEWVV